MPIYEFQCNDCDERFDVFTKRVLETESEEYKELSCSKCQSKNIERLISLSSFELLGGGWAKDNYHKKPDK